MRQKFEQYELKAKNDAKEPTYSNNSRGETQRSHRLRFVDGPAAEAVLQGSEQFRVETYLPVVDSLPTGLTKRLKAYEHVDKLSGFLILLNTTTDNESEDRCDKISNVLSQDIDRCDLISECELFKHYQVRMEMTQSTVAQLYKLTINNYVESTIPKLILHCEYTC